MSARLIAMLFLSVIATVVEYQSPSALAAFAGRDGRLVAIESKFDAGQPCGDSAGHMDCGDDDSVVTFRSDGSHRKVLARRVTNDDYTRYSGPAWSPDGRRIAFLSGLRPATMHADGTHLRKPGPSCCFYSIAWARDGKRLLLGGSSTTTSNDGIYALRLKDHRLRRLTHGPDSKPASSTTGAIAFVRTTADQTSWIYVIRRPGHKPQRLLRGSDPDWSPDGKRLAFARADGIHTASASGRRLRRITQSSGRFLPDREPAWSPSGKWIALVRYPHLYVVRSDGREGHNIHLTDSPNLFFESPCWQALK